MGTVNMKKKIMIFIVVSMALIFSVCLRLMITKECFNMKENKGTAVPILMYHNITDKSYGDKYTVTAAELEEDLKYISENGYTAIGLNDLINYTEGKGKLPQKPIIITFDDGFESLYTLGLPLFKKYNCKAVAAVIGSYTQLFTDNEDHNIEYSHLNWEEINEMAKSGLIEIQNHTYDLHEIKNGRKGAAQKNGESIENYKKVLEEDVKRLNKDVLSYTGQEPTSFIYPYGNFNENTEKLIEEMGFKAILNCYEKVNYISASEDLKHLCRFLRPSGISSVEFFKRIEKQEGDGA